MSQHRHAVLENGVVVNIVIIDPITAAEFSEMKVFGDADLVDLDGLDPVPGIGWTRAGDTWSPPPAPEPVEDAPAGEPEANS